MANRKTLRIRTAKAGDRAAWTAMRCALWPDEDAAHHELTQAYVAGVPIADVAEVLIADGAAGEAVGFAELSVRTDLPLRDGMRAGYVEGLYVDPAMRHRGVARALLAAARAWARQQGCDAFASDRDDRIVVDRTYRLARWVQ